MSVDGGSTSRVNNFDLLRLIAASQVMIDHSFAYLRVPMPAALKFLAPIQGVPIFFVISGFLIFESWKRSPTALDYAIRRGARILPGLWSCIFATLLIAMAFGTHVPLAQGSIWILTQMAGLIYTPAFLFGFGIGAYNTSLWTIPVELQFYVAVIGVYAVAKVLGVRRAATGIFIGFTIIAAILYVTWLPPLGQIETGLQKLVRYSFVPHFYMFMAGVVIREWGLHKTRLLRNRALYWIAAYAAFYLIVPGDPLHHPLANIVGRLLLAFTVISAAYTLPNLSERLLGRETDISYGIYIYHGMMINVMVMLGMTGAPIAIACVLVSAPIVAALSWFFVEKPILKFAHQKTDRSPKIDPSTAAPTVA